VPARSSLKPKREGGANGGWPGVRRVAQCDRFAIAERCALCGGAIVAATKPPGGAQGGWLGVRGVAQGDRFAIDARCACCGRPDAAGGDTGGRRR
jgi:hypothetical protein